jgi:hypothetical protein
VDHVLTQAARSNKQVAEALESKNNNLNPAEDHAEDHEGQGDHVGNNPYMDINHPHHPHHMLRHHPHHRRKQEDYIREISIVHRVRRNSY